MVQVAIDAGPLHGPRTGVGNAVEWTIDALERGHDDIELLPYVTSMRARLSESQRRLPMPAAVAQRLWARSSKPAMDRWLGNPDVIHGTNYVVPPAHAARLISVYDCWFLEHRDDVDSDVRRAGDVLTRAVQEGAHIVTSSDATSDRVRELLDTDRVTTVHLGPPPPIAETPRRPSRLPDEVTNFVLALGTIERRKNMPTLVTAFGRLAREHETVRLVIAGRTGDDEQPVAAALSEMPTDVRARVVQLGPVEKGEKSWLLHNAALLAYPSLDEGFGFPILEAQLADTPVVASSAGSIPEVAGPAALFSLPTDPDALAVNLYGVLTDATRREQLIDAGRRNVDRFSWATTAALLADLYRSLAA